MTMPMRLRCAPRPVLPLNAVHWAALCACLWALPVAVLASDDDAADGEQLTHVRESALSFRQFRGVEITGSAIMDPRARQALPVTVLGRRDIERSGARNLIELLHNQSVMLGFGEPGGLNPSELGGQTSAAIHGYEAGTLLLLNGLRLAPFPRQRVDKDVSLAEISQIPLNAVERIDILVDGASSRYGSDAIAGVVNIVTRDFVSQPEISVQESNPQGAGGTQRDLQISWGRGRLEREGQALQLHLSLSESQMQLARQRSQTQTAPRQIGTDAQGQALYVMPIAQPYQGGLVSNGCPSDHFVSPVAIPGTDPCRYDVSQWMSVYPQEERRSLFASYELALNNGHVLFAEQLLHQEDQAYRSPRPMGTSQEGWPSVAPTLLPTGMPQLVRDKRSWRSSLGLRGNWGDTDYRLALSIGAARGDDASLLTGYAALLAPTPKAAALDLAGGSSAGLDETTPPAQERVELDRSRTQLVSLNAQLSGTLADWPAGTPRWGLGLSLQHERQNYQPLGRQPLKVDHVDVRRRQLGAFGELSIPLTERTEANASLRFDDTGSSGTAWTGKLSVKQRVGDTGFVRGSLGTGFRSPSPMQTLPLQWITLSRVDPACAANPGSACGYYVAVGNPDLKPERSRQFWLGYQNDPSPRWSYGVDYWRFDVKDIFGALGIADIRSNPEFMALYFQAGSPGVPYQYTGLNQNLGKLERSGLDYRLQHRVPTAYGRLRVSLNGTRYIRSKRNYFPGRPMVSELGQYQSQSQSFIPKNQLNLSLSLERNGHWFGLALRHTSGHAELATVFPANGAAQYTLAHQVKANWRVDLNGSYQASPALQWLYGIDNLFDRYPSAAYQHPNSGVLATADTRQGDYRGRRLKLGLKLRF